ncbi:MAG TPA: hypothetical protein DCG14_06100 [Phycisphaerales bacterium]|nr:hypothetical protein [Phycisphaerales bacterium]
MVESEAMKSSVQTASRLCRRILRLCRRCTVDIGAGSSSFKPLVMGEQRFLSATKFKRGGIHEFRLWRLMR